MCGFGRRAVLMVCLFFSAACGKRVGFLTCACSCCAFAVRGQIFGEDMEEDFELGEALRGDITDNPLDIYMRVR